MDQGICLRICPESVEHHRIVAHWLKELRLVEIPHEVVVLVDVIVGEFLEDEWGIEVLLVEQRHLLCRHVGVL